LIRNIFFSDVRLVVIFALPVAVAWIAPISALLVLGIRSVITMTPSLRSNPVAGYAPSAGRSSVVLVVLVARGIDVRIRWFSFFQALFILVIICVVVVFDLKGICLIFFVGARTIKVFCIPYEGDGHPAGAALAGDKKLAVNPLHIIGHSGQDWDHLLLLHIMVGSFEAHGLDERGAGINGDVGRFTMVYNPQLEDGLLTWEEPKHYGLDLLCVIIDVNNIIRI
jgi:hypothetical protein